MSVNDKYNRPFGTSIDDGFKEIRNNNHYAEDSLDGDGNANEIQRGHGGTSFEVIETLSSVVSRTEERVIIQGTDSLCDNPELAEFEMLESKELKNDEENSILEGDMKRAISTNMIQTEAKSLKNSKMFFQFISNKQESTVCPQSTNKVMVTSIARTEFSSENDVFVSCLSTMSSLGGSLASALDHAGRTQSPDSWHALSGAYQTLSEDLTLASESGLTILDKSQKSVHTEGMHHQQGKSTRHISVDLNLNPTPLPEAPLLEAQDNQPATYFVPYDSSGQLTNCMSECKIARIKKVPNESGITSQYNLGEPGINVKEYRGTEVKASNLKTISTENKPCQPLVSDITHSAAHNRWFSHDSTGDIINKLKSQNDESPKIALKTSKITLKDTPVHSGVCEHQPYKKQASFEKTRSSSASSLERRRPWGSPSRPETPPSPKTIRLPWKQPPSSPAKPISTREASQERNETLQRGTTGLSLPSKSFLSSSSSLPKPATPQQPTKAECESKKSSSPQKPKNVRPKIITYVRKSPQVKPMSEVSYEVSTLPPRLYSSSPTSKDSKAEGSRGSPVLSSSNILYEKYSQEVQRSGYYSPPGLKASGIRPLSHTVPHKLVGKSESFHGELPDQYVQGGRVVRLNTHDAAAAVFRFTRALKPQLGLRAVTRHPATKNRIVLAGQRSASPFSYMGPAVQEPSSHQELAGPHSSSDETLLSRSPLPSAESRRSHNRSSPPPPARRSLHPSPRASPVASRKEFQRDGEITRPIVSSPKRFAVLSPKPQSPVRQKSCVARLGWRAEGVDAEWEQLMVQKLKERCEDQARQLITLQDKLRKSSQCLDVFTITTQHFCQKSENAAVKERELSLQLARIRDDVVVSVQRWECLQGEKAQLEQSFERELKGLQEEQQQELKALQQRLVEDCTSEIQRLQQQQNSHLVQLRSQHQEQIEEMSEKHERAVMEMEATHGATLVTLQEEHTRTVKNLKTAHEQQKKSMEEEFENLRLSLQDQVDTLTFQNRALRDRAKRFEEALRRSTDEQIVDALAPYQHIEEDLKSLKEVLEMKNQQIHQQELKISELEKMAQKNVMLEERIQVLQQQNEDLKDRIDRNLAMSRQLSEENANLQVYVEKESNEKKRLSRTNEELMWRLQTGELSPRMSPTQSPLHRSASSPASPSRQQPFPR
ncbi:microtubule-associated tumor suppressor candidate 2 homolog [Carassius auratus]|uniref:Microtubule-associated tumor suppressor candidate 2 homolog n=1 Tax=Carassius auratus TaxID=7957 RepID=A0A6P6PEE8_CARAU|nr:microtubule-associated tumor suppressor candidate 2 homolog [Carassius auratus]